MHICMHMCIHIYIDIHIYIYIYIYIYRWGHLETSSGQNTQSTRPVLHNFIGWPKNHFNNLHFIISLETN